MKPTFKKIYLIGVLSLLSMTAYAQSNTIAGNYQCQRTDAQNNATSSPLNISSTGDTYTLQWTDSNGYPTIYGTGATSSASGLNNLLSVVYWDAKNADNYGNELFTIKPDGSLQGEFVVQSANKIGTETCTKSKS